MKTLLADRPSMTRTDADPLSLLLHADELREGCRLVRTERKFRWVKELQWWKDLSEHLDLRGGW